jgi:NADH-quinone oxidoreductase subunit H
MGLGILGVVLAAGSLNLSTIMKAQAEQGWFAIVQPLGFIVFVVASFAEAARLPFDLPEAEQELIGGYHTEYSGIKFLLFFVGEYTHLTTVSFLMAILFFGGWHFPGIAGPDSAYAGVGIVKMLILVTKMAFFIMLIMLLRWTLPRFRFDQLMGLAWKVLMPLALGNLLCAMVVMQFELNPGWLLALSILLFIGAGWLGVVGPRRNSTMAMSGLGRLHANR